MPRPTRDAKRKLPPPINPTAAYTRRDLMALMPDMGYDAIAEEIRAGRLRRASRVGRDYFLGQWLLDWLAAGEVAATLAGSRSP